MTSTTIHLAVYDTLADWEAGHLLAELRTGRFTGRPFDVVTAGVAPGPVTTMGGLRLEADVALTDVDPVGSALLVLPGAEVLEAGGAEAAAVAETARRFVDAGVPVAAICGATWVLAGAGLLDDRRHTGPAREYLAATGYAGGEHYVDERAVGDRGLVTAGPQSPVQFAAATLRELGLADDATLAAYEAVFADGDAAGYGVLAAAAEGAA